MRSAQDTTNLHKLENLVKQARKLAAEIEVTTSSSYLLPNALDWRRTLDDVLEGIKETK